MKLGFVGLGKMGSGMVRRLARGGHRIVAFDPDPAARRRAARKGVVTVRSLQELPGALSRPRLVWVMVPAGKSTESVIRLLSRSLSRGDLIIDGGNSFYRDSIRRAADLRKAGIGFLDVGTSGGIRGASEGYCLMIGGDPAAGARAEAVFKSLAQENGYARVGPAGAGHFVKMVHNGIEYALLEGYAEGFEILKAYTPGRLNLRQIARLWNRGSVVRSWLLELAEEILRRDPGLAGIRGYVQDSGEGRWAVGEAVERHVPAPAITLALLQRLRSRQKDSYAARFVAGLRREFGGHTVKKVKSQK